jgi:hypothetical protein
MTEIFKKKQIKNYKVQYLVNSMLENEIKKNKFKILKNNKKI